MYKSTIEALKIILNDKYDKDDPVSSFKHLSLGKHLMTVGKGETILYQKDPAKYFYFLLSGRTIILNHISWSIDSIIDYVEPPHILGLLEYLTEVPAYTAFVVADTPCVLFRIAASDYIPLIQNNSELCFRTLIIMGKVSHLNMERAERQRIFPQIDILGHYLYIQARYETPYTCPLTRKVLADELSINLRTLYRYLDKMEEQGYLILRHGKIVIEQQQLNNLAARYGNIIL